MPIGDVIADNGSYRLHKHDICIANATHAKCSVLAECIINDNLGSYNKFRDLSEFRDLSMV